jgi:response regulator RpfG family c-di-GMP phosphodiesterase
VSLNQTLSRKLQISDQMKNIILATHERIDEKGFPNKLKAAKIPFESMLIQISEMVDRETIIKMGKERKNIKIVRTEVYQKEEKKTDIFPLTFLLKIKEFFMTA